MLLIILLAAAVAWVAVLVLVMSLCRAAKAGDEMLAAQAHAANEPARTGTFAAAAHDDRRDELGVGLAARQRPTQTRALPDRHAGPPSAATEPRLSLSEAADRLGVEPDVLLAWEARYHYPTSTPSPGGDLGTYREMDVIALASALQGGLSISAAVSAAMSVTARRSDTAHRSPHRQSPGAA